MIYLIIVSIIWSLSFSLIKGSLTGIDPFLVSFIRLLLSAFVFLPFLRINKINLKLLPHLLAIGALQYGLMYATYIYSYQYLKAYEIAILTIFTPIFVILISETWNKQFSLANWIKAILATIGAGIIIYSDTTRIGLLIGVLLVLSSNLFFAFGQIYYKRINQNYNNLNQISSYSIVFIGGVLVTFLLSLFTVDINNISISANQWLVLIYLGVIASGVGFFLWNYGATKVQYGNLAVMNNLKIPLGVLVSIIILDEKVTYFQFIIGGLLILISLFVKSK